MIILNLTWKQGEMKKISKLQLNTQKYRKSILPLNLLMIIQILLLEMRKL